MSPLGSPIVLQRKGSVYGANVPMITELVNDSNVQFLDQAWLPDGDSQILRLYVFGPSGLKDYGSATLRCKI